MDRWLADGSGLDAGAGGRRWLYSGLPGSDRYILDYLVEEVLQRQPESVQTFLLQTAILDRLTGPLRDAVTSQDDGQVTLEMLEQANLFIVRLDDERSWYRYHRLFADLLRKRLHHMYLPRHDAVHGQSTPRGRTASTSC